MKCPHCNYVSGLKEGEYGDFFDLSNGIIMMRDDGDELCLVGCPKCKKVFMG